MWLCWKLHGKWEESWYCSHFCSWQNTQKCSDYYIKEMIVIFDLRDCYLSLTTARHSSITWITDTSAGTRLSRTGIVHICKSHTYLHTNYLKLAINSSILCILVFVVFWSNFKFQISITEKTHEAKLVEPPCWIFTLAQPKEWLMGQRGKLGVSWECKF